MHSLTHSQGCVTTICQLTGTNKRSAEDAALDRRPPKISNTGSRNRPVARDYDAVIHGILAHAYKMMRAVISGMEPWPSRAMREGYLQYCWSQACEKAAFKCELNGELRSLVCLFIYYIL